jgi:shikimate dehydrogenase
MTPDAAPGPPNDDGAPAGVSWPSAASTVVGVIGDPIAHSLSPLLHNTAFTALGLDWVSVGLRVEARHVAGAVTGIRTLGLAGVSVTMPHKAAVAELVDDCSALARRLGAVNCIVRRGDRLVGENTDGDGFLTALRRSAGFDPRGRRCLVAGAGGAARAVVLALAEAGAAEVVVCNRSAGRARKAATLAGSVGRVGQPAEAGEMDLVVDATPVGMGGTDANAGDEGGTDALVSPALLHPGQLVVDLVYRPPVTQWLRAAAGRGATVVGGLGMLVHQAALQIELWTGKPAPVEAMWSAANQRVRVGG